MTWLDALFGRVSKRNVVDEVGILLDVAGSSASIGALRPKAFAFMANGSAANPRAILALHAFGSTKGIC